MNVRHLAVACLLLAPCAPSALAQQRLTERTFKYTRVEPGRR